MKRKLTAKALILPLLVAFMVLLPLLGAAVIGEHRYEKAHPAYLHHLWQRLLGDEPPCCDDASTDLFSGAEATFAKDGTFNILVVGKDEAAGLTDVMMLASLNTNTHELQLIHL